jgi:hypothetical protein
VLQDNAGLGAQVSLLPCLLAPSLSLFLFFSLSLSLSRETRLGEL